MKKPIYLSREIALDEVTKVEFPTRNANIISQGLHFVPPCKEDEPIHQSIISHTHDTDSERYYLLKKNKNDNGIIDFEWEPLEPVSASTPDSNTHSVQSSNDIQIIFGVKRPDNFNKTNWPKDRLPYVSYNDTYDLIRLQFGYDVIYTHSDFKEILYEEDAKIYIAPPSRDKKNENKEGNYDYTVAQDNQGKDIQINITSFRNVFDEGR